MRRFITLLFMLFLFFTASGCDITLQTDDENTNQYSGVDANFNIDIDNLFQSNEEKGVPEKQVENELLRPYYREYVVAGLNIQHNVDTELHTDYVTISCSIIYNFEQSEYESSGIFYYDKSTDRWTLDERSFVQNENRRIDEKILGLTFRGSDKHWENVVYYELYVDSINDSEGWIHFTYVVTQNGSTSTGDAYIETGNFRTTICRHVYEVAYDNNEGLALYFS